MARIPVAVTALVTLLTLVTFSVTTAVSKTPPGKAVPANTAAPSISGTVAVGSTLQASSGSWKGRNISYSFQWKRCDSSGGNCSAITGATGSSYLIGSADAGHTLRVSVTASNKNGSATATSAPSDVVPSSSYTNVALPAISGTAEAGQTLTVSNGSWSPGASSFGYAWHRCQNGSCSLSPTNANQKSYVVQSGDVGYTILAEVAPDSDWSQSADSNPTAAATGSTQPSGTFTTSLTAGGSITTPYTWTFDPGVASVAGEFWIDGTQVDKVTGSPPYTFTVPSGLVGDGTHTFGHSWDLADGTHQAPASGYTETVTNSTPPPPSGTVAFDGRAKLMNTLYSYETTYGDIGTLKQAQDPNIWACLCFMQNDISLVSDSRYGKAYKVEVPTGDANPWNWSATYQYGAGQLTKFHYTAADYGTWSYYGIAVKVPSWNGVNHLYFADIASLGYQTIQGDQVSLKLLNNGGVLSYAMQQNSGQLTQTSTGWWQGAVSYKQPFMPVTYGQWEDFVIAVKWTADNTGGVEVYARNPAQTSTFTKVFSKLNVPTYAIGSTSYSTWTVAKLQDPSTRVLDKIGLYFQQTGGESETVYESGLTRSSDLATAESTLP